MKSRLYYAISCFLLAVVLLFLAVPLFTHRLYPKQQQYVKRQKRTVFYASVIVRSNEELAEKLLAEQESFFE